jgi:hypothetical protein
LNDKNRTEDRKSFVHQLYNEHANDHYHCKSKIELDIHALYIDYTEQILRIIKVLVGSPNAVTSKERKEELFNWMTGDVDHVHASGSSTEFKG